MNRYKKAYKASILGILGNIFLLIIKLIAGFITNSQAMISDAVNSLSDIVSSVMTYIGNKIASKEADDYHILGYGKAEYIFSLLISITMILLSLQLIYNSINSLFSPYNYTFSWAIIIVTITTIIIKFLLFIYTRNIAKSYNNLLIEANALDHRNDCFISTFNLIAGIFGIFGITIIDGIVGTLIASWIFVTGIKLFRESYDVLMDKAIDEKTKICDISKLKRMIIATQSAATLKAYELKDFKDIFKDKSKNINILKYMFNLKIIKLEDVSFKLIKEDDKFFVQFFDDDVLDEKFKIDKEIEQRDLKIRFNKKVKIFDL